MKFFRILIISLLSAFSVLTAQVSEVERQALIDLYNSTNGDNWTNTIEGNAPWLINDNTSDVSDWFGVIVTSGKITSLSMPNNNLEGKLVNSFGDLVNLTFVNLAINKLSGSLPNSISNLSNVQTFTVERNSLDGVIPSNIGLMAALEVLNLGSNRITGAIPNSIGDLSNLKILNLFANRLDGTIPDSLGQLSNLTLMNLFRNNIEGRIPPSFGNLTRLQRLNLYTNKLDQMIPEELGGLTNLIELQLQVNLLEGSIPTSLGDLPYLTTLNIQNNNLSGTMPTNLSISAANNVFNNLRFSNNRFVFNDFESEFNNYNANLTALVYSPQAKVDQEETLSVAERQSITLTSAALTSNNNSYQWYKNGIAITGATSKDYVISNASEEDAGEYYFKATNSIVDGLTLTRNTITLEVTETGIILGPIYNCEDPCNLTGNFDDNISTGFNPNASPIFSLSDEISVENNSSEEESSDKTWIPSRILEDPNNFSRNPDVTVAPDEIINSPQGGDYFTGFFPGDDVFRQRLYLSSNPINVTIGEEYVISFYQTVIGTTTERIANGNFFAQTNVGAKGKWHIINNITFNTLPQGQALASSPEIEFLGFGNQQWEYVEIRFTPNVSTLNLSLVPDQNIGLMGIDDVRLSLSSCHTANKVTRPHEPDFNGCEDLKPITPNIVISDAPIIIEGDDAIFPVSLSEASDEDITITFAAIEGTASLNDFVSEPIQVIFLAGETTKTVTIPTLTDSLVENEESFTLTVQTVDTGSIGDSSDTGNVSIADNDNDPCNDSCNILDTLVDGTFEVFASVAGGNSSGTYVGYNSNVTTRRLPDGELEPSQWFNGNGDADTWLPPISLTDARSGFFIASGIPESPQGGVFAGSVYSTSTPWIESFYTNVSTLEVGKKYKISFYQANAGLKYRNDTRFTNEGEKIGWEVTDRLGNHSFNLKSEPSSFLGFGNQVWEYVELEFVAVTTDISLEFTPYTNEVGERHFYMAIDDVRVVSEDTGCFSHQPGHERPHEPGFIDCEEDRPVLIIDDAPSVSEGDDAIFPVSLSEASDEDITITFAAIEGTASLNDFVSEPIQVIFLAGETTKTVTIPTLTDGLVEDEESFTLVVQTVNSGNIADTNDTGSVSITDNSTDPCHDPCNILNGIVDGTFENLSEVAGTGDSGYNSIVTASKLGWLPFGVTPDTWLSPISSTTRKVGVILGGGMQPSPQGGVFAACLYLRDLNSKGDFVEGIYKRIDNLEIGQQYTVSFYQSFAGSNYTNRASKINDKAFWEIKNKLTDVVLGASTSSTFLGFGNQVWDYVEVEFVADNTNIELLFLPKEQSDLEKDIYMAIDDIRLSSTDNNCHTTKRAIRPHEPGFANCEGIVPNLIIDDAPSVSEGDDAIFPVSLSQVSDEDITITFVAIEGTASLEDFVSAPVQVIFLAGETTKTVTIPTLTDGLVEDEESFTLVVQTVNSGNIADTNDTGSVSITADPLGTNDEEDLDGENPDGEDPNGEDPDGENPDGENPDTDDNSRCESFPYISLADVPYPEGAQFVRWFEFDYNNPEADIKFPEDISPQQLTQFVRNPELLDFNNPEIVSVFELPLDVAVYPGEVLWAEVDENINNLKQVVLPQIEGLPELPTDGDPNEPSYDQIFTPSANAKVKDLETISDGVIWFNSYDSDTVLDPETTLKDDTNYYAALSQDGCRQRVYVEIAVPNVKTTGYRTFCKNDEATINDLGIIPECEDCTIRWYTSSRAFTTYSTDTLLEDGVIYYVVQVDAEGNESRDRKPILVNLNQAPPVIILSDTQTVYFKEGEEATVSQIRAKGNNVQWYLELNDSIALQPDDALINGHTYYGTQRILASECESSERVAVTITLAPELPPKFILCEKFRPNPGDTYVFSGWVRQQEMEETSSVTRNITSDQIVKPLFLDLLNFLLDEYIFDETIDNAQRALGRFIPEILIPAPDNDSRKYDPLKSFIIDSGSDNLTIYNFKYLQEDRISDSDNIRGKVTTGFQFSFTPYLNKNQYDFRFQMPMYNGRDRYPILNQNKDIIELQFDNLIANSSGLKAQASFSFNSNYRGRIAVGNTNGKFLSEPINNVLTSNDFKQYKPNFDYQVQDYEKALVKIIFEDNQEKILPNIGEVSFKAKGVIIDGWQRISGTFKVPNDAFLITIELKNTEKNNAVNAYFDDVRVHPVDSNLKSFVYDPITQRLTAEMDENNYATFYEYDKEGGLIRVKKETERGIFTIQETRSGSSIINSNN